MKLISLWSGGKDSCLAYYRARNDGYDILALFNFLAQDNKSTLSHALPAQLIQSQARMLGMPLLQKAMPKATYEEEFKDLIKTWKAKEDIRGIVFGDIYLEEHKVWIDRVCRESGVEAIYPLWAQDTKAILEDFINSGFEAIVVSTKAKFLGKEWLGRRIDKKFIEGLKTGIDPCGENGEFHTFVYNGPIFKSPIEFKLGKKWYKDEHWFQEVF